MKANNFLSLSTTDTQEQESKNRSKDYFIHDIQVFGLFAINGRIGFPFPFQLWLG